MNFLGFNVIQWVLDLPAWVWITIAAHLIILGGVAYMILLERKVASWTQDRLGPNRVGLGFGIIPGLKNMKMWGLGQPLADGLKFIVKEDYRARGVDKILFTLAPMVMVIVVIISIAVVPMGGIRQAARSYDVTARPGDTDMQQVIARIPVDPHDLVSAVPVREYNDANGVHHIVWNVTYRYHFQIANLNIGVLYVLATLSLAVYGVVIGGWASNNKYSFLGGLRATANMISYEIPLGLAVLCIVVMFGTLDLERLVELQARYWAGAIPSWNVFSQPLAFLMFLVCIHAEANRAPFDLAEAEQELVGGYHTEYSSMRFAIFFLAEYAGMVTTSVVCVALFFGGWHVPGLDRAVVWAVNHMGFGPAWIDATNPAVTNSLAVCLFRAFAVVIKTLVVIFVFMWVRWSLPRFRFDQLMMLAWRALIPMSLALLVMTAVVIYYWPTFANGVADNPPATAGMLLLGNVILLAVTMATSMFLPPAPLTNRKMFIAGSRFARTPLPAGSYN